MPSATRIHRTPSLRVFATIPLLLCLGNTVAAQIIHDYTVTLDASLDRLSVEARFAEPVQSISARESDARDVLIDARECETDKRVRTRGRRLVIPADGIQCLRYTVNLKRAARNERRNESLSAENFIVSPAIWLWRPPIDESTEIRVRFSLPDNISVAVPWHAMGNNTYLFGRSPESANAPVVFGRFEYHEVNVADATLRVSMVQSNPAMDADVILDWLSAAATDVTLAYGRFPNPSPQIIVFPVGDRGNSGRWSSPNAKPKAVRFGRVVRDGGESVELFVNPGMPLEDYLSDWTATHEFSHLMLPYVSRRHKWISEGFAQYYQNVLLARSGAYEQRKAWQKLYDGLERGRQSSPQLSPNGAASGSLRNGLMKVYWSGAALALLADVTLRERSNGEESLDLALDRLQACCLPAAEVWTGPELMAKLDSTMSVPVFMPLYRQHADTAGFPDITEILEQLGVHIADGKVELRSDAELATVRSAITAMDPEIAVWRQKLAAN